MPDSETHKQTACPIVDGRFLIEKYKKEIEKVLQFQMERSTIATAQIKYNSGYEVEDMLRRKDVDMLSGSIMKGLLVVAIPIMVMNVLQSMFNMVDMTVLKSHDTDGMSVGAVGTCSTLIALVTNLVVGIATGANAVVAKHLGRRDPAHARRAAGTALLFSVFAGFTMTVIGVTGAKTFLQLVNCPEELMSRAVLYFRMYFLGVPILTVYNFASAILRSSGNSRQIMIITLTGGAVKLTANYLFVAVLGLGVVGVSLATITSWLVFLVMALWELRKEGAAVRILKQNIYLDKAELKAVLRIGLPSGVQMAMYAIANVSITAAVNSFGKEAATGISIANTFDSIQYNLSHAASLAVLPYVSQNIGAGNVKRATKSVWMGNLMTVGIAGSIGVLAAIFAPQLSSLMSDNPQVIAYSCQKMYLISSSYFICGIYDVFGAALRGMGRPMVPTIATMLFMCGLRFVWVYVIFPLLPQNLTFLYLAWPVGWVLSIALMACALFPQIKKLKKYYAEHPVTA